MRTLEEMPEGATHWSKRDLAKRVGISPTSVHRIGRAFGLQPWRTEDFKISPDPQMRQLAVLDDAGRTSTGQSSVEVLGVPGAVLAEKLTGHLVRQILLRGSGGGPLTPLADQLNHDLTHLQLARLVALGIAVPTPSGDAGSLAREVGPARPAGAVRVSEADPRRLGVHTAISASGVPDEVPPEYVPRDVDTAEFGVRAWVAAAGELGGFVLSWLAGPR